MPGFHLENLSGGGGSKREFERLGYRNVHIGKQNSKATHLPPPPPQSGNYMCILLHLQT